MGLFKLGTRPNMFRLAKEQGYETYFYSAQAENEMAILNLIGKKWIDHLIQPTQLGYGNGDNMPDEKLLPLLDKINLQQGRHFIVLHQRGSHAPYGALLQPQDKVFGEADIVDKYDNTIHKTDQMIQTVFEQLQKQPDGNWLFAYTSDHGQYVRQDIYNQGTVQPDAISCRWCCTARIRPCNRLPTRLLHLARLPSISSFQRS